MTLREDRSRHLFSEENVTPRGVDSNIGPNYDLSLYHEEGEEHRGVLVVRMRLQFRFFEEDDLADLVTRARQQLLARFDRDEDGRLSRELTEEVTCPVCHRRTEVSPCRTDRPNGRVCGTLLDEASKGDDGLHSILDDSSNPSAEVTAARRVAYAQLVLDPEDPTDGSTPALQDWSTGARQRYMRSVRNHCYNGWTDVFRIKTDHHVPVLRDIGVRMDIRVTDETSIFEHWEVCAVNIGTGTGAGSVTSAVSRRSGEGYVDSRDVEEKWGESTQRGVVHEFGHMLGLPDEYVGAVAAHWGRDTRRRRPPGSIMHDGTAIRPRHYTPFADWISRQFRASLTPLNPRAADVEYYVHAPGDPTSERWTIANAGIFEGTTVR